MTSASIDVAVRAATPRVLAALMRRGADLDEAEDALQEALVAATQQWPLDGTPDDPTGWLITVAGRRLVDHWRASRSRSEREAAVFRLDPGPSAARDADDSVTLLVLCCHPALPRASQVALTLRTVAGLSTAQIARGFLVPETTMAQRISRAKARLREVGARFGVLSAAELPARVETAMGVLYLAFTEGHTATVGNDLVDVALSGEAIRLARMLHERLPGESEVAGLLALMLLTDARRAARIAADGALVPLPEQDRSLWDQRLIAEGIELVEAALPVGPIGPFQLQAVVAAVHAEAPDADDTDWAQIEVLYRMLINVAPGPMVRLNHAVAVAMVDGPKAGLRIVEPLQDDRRLARHHRLHAVRAHLLERAGRTDEAFEAYLLAARLATSVPEQRYLNDRAAALN